MRDTPVLLLIFNRPEQTRRVFEVIRRQAPKLLFIAADGPRPGNKKDPELVKECRQITTMIDWDCTVQTRFRESNLGCGAAPADAISWFFGQVDEGIILEDDCEPNDSFFDYCHAVLQKYRDDPSIMAVCGTSYQPKPLDQNSYYFSRYVHVWGWATWSRAWSKYNFDLSGEDVRTRQNVIDNTFFNPRERRLWAHNMRSIINGLDAWDYQWMYWIWKNNGLVIIPWKNMVSNIGFGELATHTLDADSPQANIHRHELSELIHPDKIGAHRGAERYERYHILIPSAYDYYKGRLTAIFKRIKRLLTLG